MSSIKLLLLIYISSAYRTKYSAGGHSRHQWGLAVDINAGNGGNPWFEKRFEDNPIQGELPEGATAPWGFHVEKGVIVSAYRGTYSRKKCIWHQAHPVVQIFKKHGWGWGGRYGDVMHFSIDGS